MSLKVRRNNFQIADVKQGKFVTFDTQSIPDLKRIDTEFPRYHHDNLYQIKKDIRAQTSGIKSPVKANPGKQSDQFNKANLENSESFKTEL